LSAVVNDNLGAGGATAGPNSFDSLDNVHALDNGSENYVLSVQPGGLGSAQEELGSICTRASIGHTEDTRSSVLEVEVLIGEFL
jgi:hypothetical protein